MDKVIKRWPQEIFISCNSGTIITFLLVLMEGIPKLYANCTRGYTADKSSNKTFLFAF